MCKQEPVLMFHISPHPLCHPNTKFLWHGPVFTEAKYQHVRERLLLMPQVGLTFVWKRTVPESLVVERGMTLVKGLVLPQKPVGESSSVMVCTSLLEIEHGGRWRCTTSLSVDFSLISSHPFCNVLSTLLYQSQIPGNNSNSWSSFSCPHCQQISVTIARLSLWRIIFGAARYRVINTPVIVTFFIFNHNNKSSVLKPIYTNTEVARQKYTHMLDSSSHLNTWCTSYWR